MNCDQETILKAAELDYVTRRISIITNGRRRGEGEHERREHRNRLRTCSQIKVILLLFLLLKIGETSAETRNGAAAAKTAPRSAAAGIICSAVDSTSAGVHPHASTK